MARPNHFPHRRNPVCCKSPHPIRQVAFLPSPGPRRPFCHADAVPVGPRSDVRRARGRVPAGHRAEPPRPGHARGRRRQLLGPPRPARSGRRVGPARAGEALQRSGGRGNGGGGVSRHDPDPLGAELGHPRVSHPPYQADAYPTGSASLTDGRGATYRPLVGFDGRRSREEELSDGNPEVADTLAFDPRAGDADELTLDLASTCRAGRRGPPHPPSTPTRCRSASACSGGCGGGSSAAGRVRIPDNVLTRRRESCQNT